MDFPGGSDDKESAHSVGGWGLIPGWRREGRPVHFSILLGGKPHGKRSLAGCDP